MILKAAVKAGATEPMIRIDWKADRIIVTVDVYADESYGAEDDNMLMWSDRLELIEWLDGVWPPVAARMTRLHTLQYI